jgi:alpha-D-ribose 1-methylphosphonate 5-triphosphate diphosphatase
VAEQSAQDFNMQFDICGGRTLIGDHFEPRNLTITQTDGSARIIFADGSGASSVIDASGHLVLPGIIDIHGDAFERQLEPRPGVRFDAKLALLETDRQIVSNGITTAYHGVTWSWEPGLRGTDAVSDIVSTLECLRPRLAADTRLHLRHETFNLEAEREITAWLRSGRIGCFAFNDHMSGTIKERHRPKKLAKMIERSGLDPDDFQRLIDRTYSLRDEVPASVARLAAIATGAGVRLLSHDDSTAEQRAWYRALGAEIAEFPTTAEAARSAAAAGEAVVFGAPNVIRGGSHTGCPSATDMVEEGLCSILASDYYYPTLLRAPFKLAFDGICTLEAAWQLVSRNPAAALGLADRGTIAPGKRADIVIVDATDPLEPVLTATIVNGRLRYLADGQRLRQI